MKLKFVLLSVIVILTAQVCFARPAMYFDADEDNGYYITDGKQKILPHWGNFREAQSLFESNPKALEFYQEYENNLSSMWTAFWIISGVYIGGVVWVSTANTSNSSATETGLWLVTGGYLITEGLLTNYFAQKAQFNLMKAVNTINGVYSSSDSSSPQFSLGVAPTSDSGGKFILSYIF